jgi:hypothetical protein
VRDRAPAAVLREKQHWSLFQEWIPLQLTEDEDLRAAVAHVGLLPPSCHALSNRLLNEEYNAVRAVDVNRLAQQKLIKLSSYGWRRRAAVPACL